MGTIGTAIVYPTITAGQFALIVGMEDKTSGTDYWTSDQSGFAHVDYGRVDAIAGGTIGGTVYGTANKNDFGYVATGARVLNLFPSDQLTAISIRRGRTRPDQFDDVGTMTVTVLNQTGDSDPDNTTGRYQRLTTPTITSGTAIPNYASWIQPGMWAQIVYGLGGVGSDRVIFRGILESVEPTDDRYSTAVYNFVDRLAILGGSTTGNGAKAGANGDTGAQRIRKLLQDCRLYDIYNGATSQTLVEQVVDIQGFTRTVQLGSVGDTVMDCIKTIVSGQAGRVFASREGIVRVWDRAYMASVASATAGTFTDTPGSAAGLGYDEIHTNQAQNFLYNSAIVTVGSAITASFKNDTSIAQYGERRYEVECALSSAGDALALATFLGSNWSAPSKNVSMISLQAYAFTSSQLSSLLGLDLQQSVRIYRRLPGGRVLDVNCVIEGIEIDIDPSTKRFTFYLSPKDSKSISWPA